MKQSRTQKKNPRKVTMTINLEILEKVIHEKTQTYQNAKEQMLQD